MNKNDVVQKALESKSYFPILIQYANKFVVIKSPEAIENGIAFVVIATNIEIKG